MASLGVEDTHLIVIRDTINLVLCPKSAQDLCDQGNLQSAAHHRSSWLRKQEHLSGVLPASSGCHLKSARSIVLWYRHEDCYDGFKTDTLYLLHNDIKSFLLLLASVAQSCVCVVRDKNGPFAESIDAVEIECPR